MVLLYWMWLRMRVQFFLTSIKIIQKNHQTLNTNHTAIFRESKSQMSFFFDFFGISFSDIIQIVSVHVNSGNEWKPGVKCLQGFYLAVKEAALGERHVIQGNQSRSISSLVAEDNLQVYRQ